MNANAITIKEKKNRKKGMTLSLLFHSAIILLALLPFLKPDPNETPEAAQVIVMDFTNFDSASKKSAKGVNNTKKSAPKKSTTKPVVEKEPQKPKVTPVPERKPVLTTPEPEVPIKVEPVEAKPEVVKKPRPVRDRVPEVSTEETAEEEVVEETSEVAEEATEVSDDTGNSDSDGTEDGGAADAGDDVADGNAGEGDKGMDFSGDGIFGRRVVYRAIDEVKKTVEEEGRIVINLCVSQEGRVVYAEFNEAESTITDKSIVRRTELAVKKYRFAKDYTAPYKQCGKLSINFTIDN